MAVIIDTNNPYVLTKTGAEVEKAVSIPFDANALSESEAAEVRGNIGVPAFWKGTQAEYDALPTHDQNTLYFIIEVQP